MAVSRQQALDEAVRNTASAWAVMLPQDRLLRHWLAELQSDDLSGIADAVVPVIQANFYAYPVRSITTPRVSMPVVKRHGGVPG